MATVLTDSPPAPASEPAQTDVALGTPSLAPAGGPAPEVASCSRCGTAMVPGQDWCLQCGAGAPGGSAAPGWRSAATLLGVTAVLALGAAAAAFAALSKEKPKPHTVTMTVAQAAPAPATTTPSTTVPITPSTAVPTTPSVKAPKIPLLATPTPTPTTTPKAVTPITPTTPSGESRAGSKSTPTGTTGNGGGEGNQPTALLLDTNAASTYNPSKFPETNFGDPSLTIDGDPTTGWTAIVEPATAPAVSDGVLIDLKTPHKIASLALIIPTLGMTVQVFGANGATPPATITDPAWTAISHPRVIAKHHAHIKLKNQKTPYTYVLLWVSKAPATAVGTPQAPGHVSVNEIELFPAH